MPKLAVTICSGLFTVDELSRRFVRRRREDDAELLAAEAEECVGRAPQAVVQRLRDGPQHRVAGLVSMMVVVGLEVIDIQHAQRHGLAALRAGQRRQADVAEMPSVEGAGERVEDGQVAQLAVGRLQRAGVVLQSLLVDFAAGDVQVDAGQPQRAAIGVTQEDAARALDPHPMAIGMAHAEFGRVALVLAAEMTLHRRAGLDEIAGMAQALPGCAADGFELGPCSPEHPGPALIDDELAAVDVPVPGSGGRTVQHIRQVLPVLGQHRLGTLQPAPDDEAARDRQRHQQGRHTAGRQGQQRRLVGPRPNEVWPRPEHQLPRPPADIDAQCRVALVGDEGVAAGRRIDEAVLLVLVEDEKV
jgi:hypothetical protein